MRLGVDFGATRLIVAWVDRGNYPVVYFDGADGAFYDWYPPLVAVKGEQRFYGWEAWRAQEEPGWTVVRSVKRLLEGAGPKTIVQIADQSVLMLQLLAELGAALRTSLLEHSNLPDAGDGPLEIMLGVPANANTHQRPLTAEAFRQAGFRVLGIWDEPVAASVEYAYRSPRQKVGRGPILVYDLGGGTFEASLVGLEEDEPHVIASEGIGALGGDDFDRILAELALDAARISAADRDSLSPVDLFRLLEECRVQKESLHSNIHRIAVDLGAAREGWPNVTLPVAQFYERCRPLVEETLHVTADLREAHGYAAVGSSERGQRSLEVLYVTGGGSALPLVARMLHDAYGHRMKYSAHTRFATAIGLAIQADAQAEYAHEQADKTYSCDADGAVSVKIANLSVGDSRWWRVGGRVPGIPYCKRCLERLQAGAVTEPKAVPGGAPPARDAKQTPAWNLLTEKPKLLVGRSTHGEPIYYRCSYCQERFRLSHERVPIAAVRELCADFRKHVRNQHPVF